MDEYICPNCGAVLNYQGGFDPSCGSWTCTCCGKHLMDDDVYEGHCYSGVAWYCDDCGALLNRQSGFADFYSFWTCTECGYSNKIAKTEIYESQEDYEQKKEYSHIANDLAEILVEAAKVAVKGYSQKRQQEIEEEEMRKAEAERIRKEQEEALKIKKALWKKRAKAFLFKGKKIPIHYYCEELANQDALWVSKALEDNAFTNVEIVPIKDIYVGSAYNIGQVEQVAINGTLFFRQGDLFPYDAEIVITYHDKCEIVIPFSERKLRKMGYSLARDTLLELGFTNINEKPIRDLTFGWMKKDGLIEKIVIGDDQFFKKDSVFPYDVKITIEYHTFKK